MLGGLAPLKTLIQNKKRGKPHTMVTFGGDIRPSTVDGNPMESLDMIEALNEVGVDAAVFGNHEFDEGEEQTFNFIQQANFPWVSTNILDQQKQGYGGAPRYVIRKVGRFKVALIGLLTPETTTLSAPGPGVFFGAVVETAKEVVAELKAQDVDVIIALTHLSLQEDKDLMAKVPEIGLALGGHEHEPVTVSIGGRMIHKSGSNAEYLGVIDLEMTRAEGEVHLLPHWEMIPVKNIKADPLLSRKILKLRNTASLEFEKPLVKTEISIDSRNKVVRSQQSPLGSLVADAMREAMKADIGILNGGSLRGDCRYPAGSVLLLKHISHELSFANTVVLREISGETLKQIIEAALENTPDPSGGFPHISGFTVAYDSTKPKGNKVIQMSRNGNEILGTETLTLATTNFLAQGGDRFPDLSVCKGKDTEMSYTDVMTRYLEARGTITEAILKPRLIERSLPGEILMGARGEEKVRAI